MIPKNRPPAHPGEILDQIFIKPMNLSQTELAEHLKCKPGKINEIVNGKRGVTPEMALALGDAFGNDPQFWLNLQINYDLWYALKEHVPIKRLKAS